MGLGLYNMGEKICCLNCQLVPLPERKKKFFLVRSKKKVCTGEPPHISSGPPLIMLWWPPPLARVETHQNPTLGNDTLLLSTRARPQFSCGRLMVVNTCELVLKAKPRNVRTTSTRLVLLLGPYTTSGTILTSPGLGSTPRLEMWPRKLIFMPVLHLCYLGV